ncbi:MAG: redoxin domain-containing protein [Sphingobacteriaceae bacterium]|nr:redoxin domain-containing protein [Sphingobacteriaceae bacterium]
MKLPSLFFFIFLFCENSIAGIAGIEGIVIGPSSGMLILSKPFAASGDIDTIHYQNNSFVYKKELKGCKVFNLSTAEDRSDGSWEAFSFMLEDGLTIKIILNVKSIRKSGVQGGINQTEFDEVNRISDRKTENHAAFMDSIRKKINNRVLVDSINKVNWDKVNRWKLDYAETHITPSGAYLIWSLLRKYESVDPYIDIQTLIRLRNKYARVLPVSEYLTAINKYLEGSNFNKVNSRYIDIKLPNQQGERIPISKIAKNKIILIDFWASWCGPCRAKNKLLQPIYNIYDKNSFDIISISVDKSVDLWLKAIKEDRIIWNTLIDEGNRNNIQDLYHAYSLPTNFLINKEGIIVAKNIEAAELKAFLEQEHIPKVSP